MGPAAARPKTRAAATGKNKRAKLEGWIQRRFHRKRKRRVQRRNKRLRDSNSKLDGSKTDRVATLSSKLFGNRPKNLGWRCRSKTPFRIAGRHNRQFPTPQRNGRLPRG